MADGTVHRRDTPRRLRYDGLTEGQRGSAAWKRPLRRLMRKRSGCRLSNRRTALPNLCGKGETDMNDDPDVIRFVATETVADLKEAVQPLLLTSAAARAAKSKDFDDRFRRWCAELASSSVLDIDLLAVLWRLTSLGSMAKQRQRLQGVIRGGLVRPDKPIVALADPKDRKAVSEAVRLMEGDWVVPYAASAIVNDPDPKSDARDTLCRALLDRAGEVGVAFSALAHAMSDVSITQSDVPTGRARRVTWTLRAMRPALFAAEEIIADVPTGESYGAFVAAGLKSSPSGRPAAIDAVREVMLCLNGIVRLHGVSLATHASTYGVLAPLRRRMGWHDWPEELADAAMLLGVRIEEAMLALARQGLTDGELRRAHAGLFGPLVASRRLARMLSMATGIDEEIGYWLEHGTAKIQLETSSALEEAALSAVDEDLASALVEIDGLETGNGSLTDDGFGRLARHLRAAARKRGLVLRGGRGDVVPYSPGDHALDHAGIGSREVILLTPIVDRMSGGRRLNVVLKAEVEPA